MENLLPGSAFTDSHITGLKWSGISFGILFFLIFVGLGIYWFLMRRKQKGYAKAPKEVKKAPK